MMAEPSKISKLALVGEVFRPSAPVDELDLFAGREKQRSDAIGAVTQIGRHVALYGERGVGKTSLARVLARILDGPDLPGFASAMVNCNSESTYDELWSNIFRRLHIEWTVELSPEGVRTTLEDMNDRTLIVIDELDRLDDDEALTLIADTIKTLSDHAVNSTLMLVGVANSIEGLIGEHASIIRNLEQIEMPRMQPEELSGILRNGCEHTGLAMTEPAQDLIIRLSEGLPHYTHLLGYRSAERAVQDDRGQITAADVHEAIPRAIAGHTIENSYLRAIRSSQPVNLYREVLLACAIVEKDGLGYFTSGQIRAPLEVIVGRYLDIPAFSKHMKEFQSTERGSVLRREGKPRSYSYRFAEPMMQPYVIMSALNEKLITDEQLTTLQWRASEPTEPEDDPNERGQLF